MLKHRSRNTLKIKQWLFFIPVQCYTTVSCKGWWMWLIKCPDFYNFSSAKLIRFGSVFSVKTGIKLTKNKRVLPAMFNPVTQLQTTPHHLRNLVFISRPCLNVSPPHCNTKVEVDYGFPLHFYLVNALSLLCGLLPLSWRAIN